MKKIFTLFLLSFIVSCSKNDQQIFQDLGPGDSIQNETSDNSDKPNLVSDINNLSVEQQNENIQNTGFAALNIIPSDENIEDFLEVAVELSTLDGAVSSKINLPSLEILTNIDFGNALSPVGNGLTGKKQKFNIKNNRLQSKLLRASKSAVVSETYVDGVSQKVFDLWSHKVSEFIPLHVIDKNDPTKFTILKIEMNNPTAEYELEVPPGDYIYIFGTPREDEIISQGFDEVAAATIVSFYDIYDRYLEQDYYLANWPYGFTDELEIFDAGNFSYGIGTIPALDITPATTQGLITIEKEELVKAEIISDYDETTETNTNAIWEWEAKDLSTTVVGDVEVFYTYIRNDIDVNHRISVNLTTGNGFTSLQDIDLPSSNEHDNYRFLVESSVELLINVLDEEAILFDKNMLNIFIALGGELNERYTVVADPVLEMLFIDQGYDRHTINGGEFDWENREWDGYIRTIDLLMIETLNFDGGNVGDLKITDLSPLGKAIFFQSMSINYASETIFEDDFVIDDLWSGREILVEVNRGYNDDTSVITDTDYIRRRLPDLSSLNVASLITSVDPHVLLSSGKIDLNNVEYLVHNVDTDYIVSTRVVSIDTGVHLDHSIADLTNLKSYKVNIYYPSSISSKELVQSSGGINYNIHTGGGCRDIAFDVFGSYRIRSGNQLSEFYTHNQNMWNRVDIFSGEYTFDENCESKVFNKVEVTDPFFE